MFSITIKINNKISCPNYFKKKNKGIVLNVKIVANILKNNKILLSLLLSITIVVDTDKCLSVSITIYQLHFVIYIKKLADFVIFENNAI